MDVLIREMKEEDIRSVQQVANISWNETYKGIIPIRIQRRFLKSAYSIDTMKRRLSNSFLFVAQLESKIIGFANFSPVNKDGETELGAIYLHPKYQGIGIGTTLLEHGINSIGEVQKVHIYVEKNNQRGLKFYHARGFKKVREFSDTLCGHMVQTYRMSLNVHHQNRKEC